MTIYPRRPIDVTNCTDLYVHDIVRITDTPCIKNPCIWEGGFAAKIYNGSLPHTYHWSVNVGSIKGDATKETCEVQIQGTHPMPFEMTVTVSGASGVHKTTHQFVTTGGTP